MCQDQKQLSASSLIVCCVELESLYPLIALHAKPLRQPVLRFANAPETPASARLSESTSARRIEVR